LILNTQCSFTTRSKDSTGLMEIQLNLQSSSNLLESY